MPNFDEAVLERPDGSKQRLNRDEFFKVPLPERVQLLWALKVKFFKGGQAVPASAALR